MDAQSAKRAIRNATQIFFTVHARLRMDQRGVTREDVRHVLRSADDVRPGDQTHRWEVRGLDLDEDELTVVVVVEVLLTQNTRNVVVTVY